MHRKRKQLFPDKKCYCYLPPLTNTFFIAYPNEQGIYVRNFLRTGSPSFALIKTHLYDYCKRYFRVTNTENSNHRYNGTSVPPVAPKAVFSYRIPGTLGKDD